MHYSTLKTRLNAFTLSCLFNATAVQYRTSRNQHKLIRSHPPGGSTTLQTPFSPVSFGKSFMKIRSAVPENGCLIFLADRKNKKKQKKTSVKHIRYRLIGGCVNKRVLSSRLKLFVLSAGSRRLSLSELQAAGPASANI